MNDKKNVKAEETKLALEVKKSKLSTGVRAGMMAWTK